MIEKVCENENLAHLSLQVQIHNTKNRPSEVPRQRIQRIPKPSQLMRPHHPGLLNRLPIRSWFLWDAKQLQHIRQHRHEKPTPTREQIDGNHALRRPGVKWHVTFQYDAGAAHSHGFRSVAVVREER